MNYRIRIKDASNLYPTTLWCHTNLTTIEINYFFLECVSDIDMSWHKILLFIYSSFLFTPHLLPSSWNWLIGHSAQKSRQEIWLYVSCVLKQNLKQLDAIKELRKELRYVRNLLNNNLHTWIECPSKWQLYYQEFFTSLFTDKKVKKF